LHRPAAVWYIEYGIGVLLFYLYLTRQIIKNKFVLTVMA
jgi:hypothetical protein